MAGWMLLSVTAVVTCTHTRLPTSSSPTARTDVGPDCRPSGSAQRRLMSGPSDQSMLQRRARMTLPPSGESGPTAGHHRGVTPPGSALREWRRREYVLLDAVGTRADPSCERT